MYICENCSCHFTSKVYVCRKCESRDIKYRKHRIAESTRAKIRMIFDRSLRGYIVFCWVYAIALVFMLSSSGRAPASVPSNLGLVVFMAWGFMGLGCVNILLSIALCIFRRFTSALSLFLSVALPVAMFFLILLGSSRNGASF